MTNKEIVAAIIAICVAIVGVLCLEQLFSALSATTTLR